MDGRRFARDFRALRFHRRLRQADVAVVAGLSRSAIERVETGSLRGMRLATLVDAADGLGAEVHLRLHWRGEGLDRLLDAAHSQLVEGFVVLLRAADRGWEARTLGVLLVVAEGSSARRRVEALAATFSVALPARGWAVKQWLRAPTTALRGLLFLSSDRPAAIGGTQRAVRRVRRPRAAQDLTR